MANPSNAGPYTVGLNSSLAAGETREIQLTEVSAGPGDKPGYLRKLYGERGGMDFIFIVNASPELIVVYTKGGSTFVPSATSQSLTNGPYDNLRVENRGANAVNTGSSDDVAVEVGNSDRSEDRETGFSPRRAVSDVIPGLQL